MTTVDTSTVPTNAEPAAVSVPEPITDPAPIEPSPAGEPAVPPKRGRGRPKGSTNRPKVTTTADAVAAAVRPTPEPERSKGGRPTVTATKSAVMREGLSNLYTGVGAMLTIAALALGNRRMLAVGGALGVQAEPCAEALVQWSEQSPAVRKALEQLVIAGGGGLVIAAHAPIIAAAFSGAEPAPVADGGPETATAVDLGTLLGSILNA